MSKASRILSGLLATALVLSLWGCPLDFKDDEKDFFLLVFGGVPYRVGIAPAGFNASDATISLPSKSTSKASGMVSAQVGSGEIEFNGFQADSGRFFINTDFTGDNEFIFPVTGQGNNGCIDFSGDGCDASDVAIEYQPSQRRFQITSPFSSTSFLGQGIYRLEFNSDLFRIPSGPGEVSDIRIEATRKSQPAVFTVPFVPGLVGYMSNIVVGTTSGLQVASSVIVDNAGAASASVRLEFFSQGMPLPLKVDGAAASALHEFQLPPGSSRRFQLASPDGTLVAGWGIVSADTVGLSASVVYTTVRPAAAQGAVPPGGASAQSGSEFVGEAGVSTVNVGIHHVLDVEKTTDGVDTALAIANPTGSTAQLRLKLEDHDGATVASGTFELAAKSRATRFYQEFFNLSQTSFSGTLVIDSDNAVAVNTLQTLNGVQTSSLESATR